MVLNRLLSQMVKAGIRDLKEQQRKQERAKREEQKRRERIEELDGGEAEYDARRSLSSLPGVGSKTAGTLYDAGYETAAQARSASIEDLKSVEGIGEKLATDISREGEVKDLDLQDGIPFDHFTEAVEPVKQLKREGRHTEAEKILLWCISQAEKEVTPPPWYFKHLAIIYRKEDRYQDEVELLERYVQWFEENGGEPRDELVERLERARELAEE